MTTHRLGHVPGLDGLRALAIIGVLLFHLAVPGAMLGWAGVQLFFVISGFLITRILLSSRQASRPFRSFYLRRALRIFPIYYLYMLLLVGLHIVVNDTEPLRHLPFYLTYTQNVPAVLAADPLRATVHTWSLAVEEQFYLFWPLAVLLLPLKSLRYVLAALFVAAPLWRLVIVVGGAHPLFALGTLPSQIDAIVIGAALAYALHVGLPTRVTRRAGWIAFWLGATLVTVLTAAIGVNSMWLSDVWIANEFGFLYLTGIAILFGGIVTLVVSGVVPQVLTWRPLEWIGRKSYGIYLYHLLVFAVVGVYAESILSAIGVSETLASAELVHVGIKLGLTMVVAAISWRFVEQPLLALKDRIAPSGAGGSVVSPRTPAPTTRQVNVPPGTS